MKKILFVLFFPLILFSQEKLTEKRAREIIDSLRKAESEIQAELSSCQKEIISGKLLPSGGFIEMIKSGKKFMKQTKTKLKIPILFILGRK
jgi:high-affinity K+ transport system ATPase subunit B